MKTTIRIAALAAFLALAGAAQAVTAAGDFALSGNFTASCSFTNPTFGLGGVALHQYVDNSGGPANSHTRLPVSIDVQCNAQDVPWTIYNTGGANGGAGFDITIGSVIDNKACLISETSPTGMVLCASVGSPELNKITGMGTMTKGALLGILHNGVGGRAPFRGQGAIVGTIPLTLEF